MRHIHIAYENYRELSHMNARAAADPAAFVEECEAEYQAGILHAAAVIAERMAVSRVVLLAGPSSSGKTTTSHRLTDALASRGIGAHVISMDDYFLTMDREDRSLDYDAPERMDIPLLQRHIAALEAEETILIPHFDFTTGIQTPAVRALSPRQDEVVIFEGIHALSDLFCEIGDPTGVYLSARMRVLRDGALFMPPEWLRYVRRSVRDERFRNSSFLRTLGLWRNVRRAELRHILPSKENAHVQLDTSLAYEPCLFAPYAIAGLRALPEAELAAQGLSGIVEALEAFAVISPDYVPDASLLREFIGKTAP
ncbi:MAG: nucleoside kinase [Ruminococcaceae bacterium]|nr:nucleoside kinase [Oscillospiraceae bacterium]